MHEYASCLTPEQIDQRKLNIRLEPTTSPLGIYSTFGREAVAVYDMGVEIPIVARCPDKDALTRTNIDAGYAAACPGYVRLGLAPCGVVTADLGSNW